MIIERPTIEKKIEKRNKFGGLTLILRLSIELHVIMTVGQWHKNRQIESAEKGPPLLYEQLIFDKSTKIQWRRDNFFKQMVLEPFV